MCEAPARRTDGGSLGWRSAWPLAGRAAVAAWNRGMRTLDLECRRVRDGTCVCGHVLLRSLESRKIGKGVPSGNPKNLKKGPPAFARIDGMTAPLHWAGMFLRAKDTQGVLPRGPIWQRCGIIIFPAGRRAGPGYGCIPAGCAYVGSCVGRRRRAANLLVISIVIRGMGSAR